MNFAAFLAPLADRIPMRLAVMSTCSILLVFILAACSLLAPANPPRTPAEAEAQRAWEVERDGKINDLAAKVGVVTGTAPDKTTAWAGLAIGVLNAIGLGFQTVKSNKTDEKIAASTVIGDSDHDKNVAEIADLRKKYGVLVAQLAAGAKPADLVV